jgi:hypothetical protein
LRLTGQRCHIWISYRRRISRRASVVVRDRRRRGEVAPAEFYCYLEEGVLESTAPAVFGILQIGE